jgi:hypothetical protein
MATPPSPFFVVEAFGPGHIGLWTRVAEAQAAGRACR